MDGGKKRSGTAVLTEQAAQAALRRGAVAGLATDEEKVMRMRLGASLPASARLARVATATDAELELLAIELEAYFHLKERRAAAAPAPVATPTSSRTKEKIVRALRKKM